MKIRFRFIQDNSAEGIEVTIRACEKNDDVEKLLSKLSVEPERILTATKSSGRQARPSSARIRFLRPPALRTAILTQRISKKAKPTITK